MKKIFILSVTSSILISTLFSSCKGKEKNNSEKPEIVVPKQLDTYNPATGDAGIISLPDSTRRLKIYTLINASCSTCLLKLKKWNNFLALVSSLKNVSIIPVCFSNDNFELLKFGFENNTLPKVHLLLVLDRDGPGSFRAQNQSLISKSGEFTALTDANNHILLMGNPTESAADSSKFMEKLQKSE